MVLYLADPKGEKKGDVSTIGRVTTFEKSRIDRNDPKEYFLANLSRYAKEVNGGNLKGISWVTDFSYDVPESWYSNPV